MSSMQSKDHGGSPPEPQDNTGLDQLQAAFRFTVPPKQDDELVKQCLNLAQRFGEPYTVDSRQGYYLRMNYDDTTSLEIDVRPFIDALASACQIQVFDGEELVSSRIPGAPFRISENPVIQAEEFGSNVTEMVLKQMVKVLDQSGPVKTEVQELLRMFRNEASDERVVKASVGEQIEKADLASWKPLDWSMKPGRGWYLELDDRDDKTPYALINSGTKAVIVVREEPDGAFIAELGGRKSLSGAFQSFRKIKDETAVGWYRRLMFQKSQDERARWDKTTGNVLELIKATNGNQWQVSEGSSGIRKAEARIGQLQIFLHHRPDGERAKGSLQPENILQIVECTRPDCSYFWEDTGDLAEQAEKIISLLKSS